MDAPVVIGLDAGTSVIKAVAFDLEGRQLASACVPNHVHHDADGGAEQDMDGTWADTAATLRELARALPGLAERTVALAATGQGDGTWLIDADGQPVGRALLWLDARSAPQVDALRRSPAADAIARRTGTALNPSMQSGQLLWLRAHQPERLARARTAFHCKDWLYFKATGERATTTCEGVFTFGNYRDGGYDRETLALLGLADLERLLPPMIDGTRHHAPLTAAAAADTGLRAGTPVVLPPMDVPATLLGSGAVAFDGDRLRHVGASILGSTGMHGWVAQGTTAIVPSAEAGYTMTMPLPDLRARLMSHMAATLNIDWLAHLVDEAALLAGGAAAPRAALVERLNALVLDAAPGQAIFHPYVADNGERGPFVDPSARAQISGFSTALGLAGMARAVFEGIALAARDCYAALGPLPDEIRLAGGAARSPALRQLLATVTGRPVRVSHRAECGAAAAALVAAVSTGHVASLRAGLATWTDACLSADLTLPDAAQAALYDELFVHYRALAASARPTWAALARTRAAHRPATHQDLLP